jgi:hypothetical protein
MTSSKIRAGIYFSHHHGLFSTLLWLQITKYSVNVLLMASGLLLRVIFLNI